MEEKGALLDRRSKKGNYSQLGLSSASLGSWRRTSSEVVRSLGSTVGSLCCRAVWLALVCMALESLAWIICVIPQLLGDVTSFVLHPPTKPFPFPEHRGA